MQQRPKAFNPKLSLFESQNIQTGGSTVENKSENKTIPKSSGLLPSTYIRSRNKSSVRTPLLREPENQEKMFQVPYMVKRPGTQLRIRPLKPPPVV
jgi:hypothetical protein